MRSAEACTHNIRAQTRRNFTRLFSPNTSFSADTYVLVSYNIHSHCFVHCCTLYTYIEMYMGTATKQQGRQSLVWGRITPGSVGAGAVAAGSQRANRAPDPCGQAANARSLHNQEAAETDRLLERKALNGISVHTKRKTPSSIYRLAPSGGGAQQSSSQFS